MLRSIHIKNFRGFRDLTFAPIERINLITGINNVGKTALLESIFLHLGPDNPDLGIRVNVMRGLAKYNLVDFEEIWGPLFSDFDTDRAIEISGKDEKGRERVLTISLEQTEATQLSAAPENGKKHIETLDRSMTTASLVQELKLHLRFAENETSTVRVRIVDDGEKKSFKIERDRTIINPPGIFLSSRSRFFHEDAIRFSKMEAVGRAKKILSLLQLLEPRLLRLAVLATSGEPIIHGDLGTGRLIPVPFLGEGTARILSLGLAIPNAEKGIILIDEIENGLHHSALKDIWKAIAEAARKSDAQIFATTHSWECIRAAHEAFEETGLYDFALHRLDRIGEEIHAVSYDQESLAAAVKAELEVR